MQIDLFWIYSFQILMYIFYFAILQFKWYFLLELQKLVIFIIKLS